MKCATGIQQDELPHLLSKLSMKRATGIQQEELPHL
jgi:hypothetical protein